jgi:Mrp family chromosome partitioning ATPase
VPTTSDVLQLTWVGASPQAASRGANAFARAYLLYRHNYLAGTIAVLNTTLTHQVSNLQHQIASVYSRLNSGVPQATRQSLNTSLAQLNGQLSTANDQLASLPTYDDSGGQVILSSPPLAPSGLGRKVILVMGLLIGLLLGVVAAFLRDSFDDRIRDTAQLERKLGTPTLVVLPSTGSRKQAREAVQARQVTELSTVANPNGRSAEAVRALRATLTAIAARRKVRTLLIVSADATLSSSQIVAELGVALAEVGRHILLIGADMRGSSLAQIFDIANNTGLSDLLVSGGDAEVINRRPKKVRGIALPGPAFKRLAVLPSGSQPTALSAVDSSAMSELMESQREAYEFVLLDSPPASVASEVIALATHVDGVIVIAREASTRGRATADLRRRLDQVGAELIGGILVGKARGGRHRSAGARTTGGAGTSPDPHTREVPPEPLTREMPVARIAQSRMKSDARRSG